MAGKEQSAFHKLTVVRVIILAINLSQYYIEVLTSFSNGLRQGAEVTR